MNTTMVASLLTMTISTTLYAGYSSTVTGPNNNQPNYYRYHSNYSSTANNQTIYHSQAQDDGFRVSVSGPNFYGTYSDNYYPSYHHRRPGPVWINRQQGDRLPNNSVIGGGENGYILYVCRANYHGGTHPGKLLPNGLCNISYGGNEISTTSYQVLTSYQPLQWTASSFGYIPAQAIVGGSEKGRVLYICQAPYMGGQHIGKIIGENCNFPYGGREIITPYYNTLVL